MELEQEDFQTVLRAAGETETSQENIQDWLHLVKETLISASDRGKNCCSYICIYLFLSAIHILFNFPFI
jgi:hypothetical protein